MKSDLPQSVKVCLWSCDTDKIDLNNENDRHLIVHQVLDRGTHEAVVWLFTNFTKTEMAECVQESAASDWGKKSLNHWPLVFGVAPKKQMRFA